MQTHWLIKCVVCSELFQQCRVGACGRRRTICDRQFCVRARQWKRVNQKEPPAWLVKRWGAAYGDARRPVRPQRPGQRHSTQRTADRENEEFLRKQRAAWVARVRHAAGVNPDLTWELLGERFGCSGEAIRRVCPDIHREPDCWTHRRSA